MTLNKLLLVINVFFLQSYLIRFNIAEYPSNLQELFITMNSAAFLYAFPVKEIFNGIKRHWLLVSLAALTGFSLLFVDTGNQLDLLRHIKFLFFAGILSFMVLETFKGDKQREAILKVMGAGALTFGLFALTYNLLGNNVTHDLRLLGPLDAAVYLAFYLAPFFIYFTIKRNWGYAVPLGLLLLATQSMGGIGASVAVLVLYFLKQKLNKKALATLGAIALITAAVIFYSKIIPTLQTEYSSLDERGEIWTTSVELLKTPRNFFLGVGYGQFEHHYIQNVDSVLGRPPLDYKVLQPHNIFLLFIFHYGILGLAIILFIIFKNIKTLSGKTPHIANFMLLYFLIHGLIDTPIFKNDLLFIFLILAEMAIPVKQKLGKSRN